MRATSIPCSICGKALPRGKVGTICSPDCIQTAASSPVGGIGPLLACALADAYGRGFEFTQARFVNKHNRMTGYIPHPKWGDADVGRYSDDTQMALGLIEHMLEGAPWSHSTLAERWVQTFRRDPRPGYSQGLYDLLMRVLTGAELLQVIVPQSSKNGGAMRAFPCGFQGSALQVRDLAMMQASVTHATWEGMTAAAAAALMFHHRYYRVGPKADLPAFLTTWLPGVDWITPHHGGNTTQGIPTVQTALTVFMESKSLAEVVQRSVSQIGDTDTIAAIAAPTAAVCDETLQVYPAFLYGGLENAGFGRDYITQKDAQLLKTYPRPEAKRAPPPPPPSLERALVPPSAEPQDLEGLGRLLAIFNE